MRFGGPVFGFDDPTAWVEQHRRWKYTAAYWPGKEDVESYVRAAQGADLVIAEVGVWNNVLHPDPQKRKECIEKAIERLGFADRVGARCAVNVAGSRGDRFDGPHPLDLTEETLEMIVQTIREIVDAVKPTRTKYSLETMPWMLPDSAETSLELVRRVDRTGFGIHFDPVNLINSPRRYFASREYVRDFIDRVGPHIVAVHIKDVLLEKTLTTHLREVRPGLGGFDLAGFFEEAKRLGDVPIMLEHLPSEEEYRLARDHVAAVTNGTV